MLESLPPSHIYLQNKYLRLASVHPESLPLKRYSILGLRLPLAAFNRLQYFSTFLIRLATRTMYSGLLNRYLYEGARLECSPATLPDVRQNASVLNHSPATLLAIRSAQPRTEPCICPPVCTACAGQAIVVVPFIPFGNRRL